MKIHLAHPLLCLLAAACGSGADAAGSWRRVESPSPAERTQLETAAAARDALATRLLAELSGAMQAGGPEQAIAVCQQRAPALAEQVSKETGVRVGRTSTRLRNSRNSPPSWAVVHVASAASEPAQFVGPEGQLGALFPIRLQPQCITCHGAPEQLAPEVKTALAMRYPNDRATGFAPGELRGWFWVEVARTE